jgi:DNA-binding phage protein
MSTNEIRDYLHKYIDNADERFLATVYQISLMNKKQNTPYFKQGQEISKEQLYKKLKESEKEIKNGDFMTIEDFINKSDKWS